MYLLSYVRTPVSLTPRLSTGKSGFERCLSFLNSLVPRLLYLKRINFLFLKIKKNLKKTYKRNLRKFFLPLNADVVEILRVCWKTLVMKLILFVLLSSKVFNNRSIELFFLPTRVFLFWFRKLFGQELHKKKDFFRLQFKIKTKEKWLCESMKMSWSSSKGLTTTASESRKAFRWANLL